MAISKEHTPDNPHVQVAENATIQVSWYGIRVPRKIQGIGVQYLRDGIVLFDNNTSAVYQRIQDTNGGDDELNIICLTHCSHNFT